MNLSMERWWNDSDRGKPEYSQETCVGATLPTTTSFTPSVPHSKHSVSVIKTSQITLYREIIAVCSQIHTKHINTLCGQNVELLNVKLAVYKDPVRTAQ